LIEEIILTKNKAEMPINDSFNKEEAIDQAVNALRHPVTHYYDSYANI